MARPTKYYQEIADKICSIISTSNCSLRTICKKDEMPSVQTILNWQNTNQDFLTQYIRAKDNQADFLAEEILEIADDCSNDTIQTEKGPQENKEWVNRSRLRVDARKWIASKLKPKKYADKVDLTSVGGPINANLDLSHLTFEQLIELKKNDAGQNT